MSSVPGVVVGDARAQVAAGDGDVHACADARGEVQEVPTSPGIGTWVANGSRIRSTSAANTCSA